MKNVRLRYSSAKTPLLPMSLPALLVIGMSGCAWLSDDRGLIVDRSDDYLDAESHQPLVVPSDLGLVALEGGVELPEVATMDAANYYPGDPPRPEVLYGLREGESIRMQRLGARQWLLVPQPVSEVWPKFMRFLSEFGVSTEGEAPVYGEVATAWIEATSSGGSPVQTLIRDSRGEGRAGSRDRFVFRLESSLRESTTEIHARHLSDLDTSEQKEWPDTSQDADLESAVLLESGRFLGSNFGTSAISLVGADVRARPKARIEDGENDRPILIFELDFERAWATLRLAIEEAGAEIQDLNREERVIYATFSKHRLLEGEEPGFFARMLNFGRSDSVEVKLLVSELDSDWGVRVSGPDDRSTDRETAEGILGLIRENAS